MPNGLNALRRNALQRGGSGAGSFADQVKRAMRDTQKLMADVGGANSDEMKAAAAVLRGSIRKTLSRVNNVIGERIGFGPRQRAKITTRADLKAGARAPRRHPSAPGQPPAVQSGNLRRSVRSGVTDGAVRVGTNYFVGRLLEDGVRSAAKPAVAKGTLITTKSGKRRKSKGKKASRAHVIEPRPFMERSLAKAESKMTDAFVSTLQRKGGG